MTTAVPHIAVALALGAIQDSMRRIAIDMVTLGSKLRAEDIEPHWRWSVWLAAAITIGRIDDGCN